MKLPEIFKNKLEDNINNNERIYIGSETEQKDIFDKLPVKVKFTTNNGEEINTVIVGKTKNYLISKNRNVYYIKDIVSIKKTGF